MHTKPPQSYCKIQTKLLKIINKNRSSADNPLHIKQIFTLESVMYHYDKLKNTYLLSESKTRNKSIILPKMEKAISDKRCYVEAKIIIKKNIKKFIKSM